MNKLAEIGLREKLAALSHEQWARWMLYLFSKGKFKPGGTWEMPMELVARWQRQMITDYEDLPEVEKDSDRKEADRIMEIIDGQKHQD